MLPPAFRDRLSILPNWQDLRRTVTHEAPWQERLAALAAYRGSGQAQGPVGRERLFAYISKSSMSKSSAMSPSTR